MVLENPNANDRTHSVTFGLTCGPSRSKPFRNVSYTSVGLRTGEHAFRLYPKPVEGGTPARRLIGRPPLVRKYRLVRKPRVRLRTETSTGSPLPFRRPLTRTRSPFTSVFSTSCSHLAPASLVIELHCRSPFTRTSPTSEPLELPGGGAIASSDWRARPGIW